MTDRIIISVNLSVMFNLWPDDRLSSPLLYFYLARYAFFSEKNSRNNNPLPSSISTQLNLSQQIQPPQHVFLFKFYWGFSTLNKKYSFFLYIFVVYIFCLGVYLFYNFFSYKFVVWIYDLYILEFVLDFIKLYFFVNWWDLNWIFDLCVL
jgi:hypothetical protein